MEMGIYTGPVTFPELIIMSSSVWDTRSLLPLETFQISKAESIAAAETRAVRDHP